MMLNAPSLTPKDNELLRREIQEIGYALEAFRAEVESGELTGFKHRGIRAREGFWETRERKLA